MSKAEREIHNHQGEPKTQVDPFACRLVWTSDTRERVHLCPASRIVSSPIARQDDFGGNFGSNPSYKPGAEPFVRERRGYPADRSLRLCEQLLAGLNFQQDSDTFQ